MIRQNVCFPCKCNTLLIWKNPFLEGPLPQSIYAENLSFNSRVRTYRGFSNLVLSLCPRSRNPSILRAGSILSLPLEIVVIRMVNVFKTCLRCLEERILVPYLEV